MKPTWTKVYGPPWDYAKQAQRMLARRPIAPIVMGVDLAGGPEVSVFTAIVKHMENTLCFSHCHDPNSFDHNAKEHDDFLFAHLAAIDHKEMLANILLDRLLELGIGDWPQWIPHLRQGEVLIKRDGHKTFVAHPSCRWDNVLMSCDLQ